MPHEHRKEMFFLLPYSQSVYPVDGLFYAKLDKSSGDVHYKEDGPVVNRPWEWTENLGDPDNASDSDATDFAMRNFLKNTGSLSLETFGVRMTGDAILHNPNASEVGPESDRLRMFGDGMHAESVWARDFRETRVPNVERDFDGPPSAPDGGSSMYLNPHSAASSPQGSGPTRSTTHSPSGGHGGGSVGSSMSGMASRSSLSATGRKSMRPSPVPNSSHTRAGSSSTNPPEVIDVDAYDEQSTAGARLMSKRKAISVDSDTEETHVTKRAKTLSGKATAKSRKR